MSKFPKIAILRIAIFQPHGPQTIFLPNQIDRIFTNMKKKKYVKFNYFLQDLYCDYIDHTQKKKTNG